MWYIWQYKGQLGGSNEFLLASIFKMTANPNLLQLQLYLFGHLVYSFHLFEHMAIRDAIMPVQFT